MSQSHMDFDEAHRQQDESQYGTGYSNPFVGSFGEQKLSPQSMGSGRSVPAGMRLALAIVSLAFLVPISIVALSIGDSPFALLKGLVGLGMVCLTIIIVNVVFNIKR